MERCDDAETIGLRLAGERTINWRLLNAARRFFEFPSGSHRTGFHVDGARLTDEALAERLRKKQFSAYRDEGTGMLSVFYRELCLRFVDGLRDDERDAWLATHRLQAVRSSLLRRGMVYVRDADPTRTGAELVEALPRLLREKTASFAAPNFVSDFQRCAPTRTPQVPAGQWHLDMIGAGEAWKSATGRGVTIAIIDDGVDMAHPALASKLARDRHGKSLERNLSPLEKGDDLNDARPKVVGLATTRRRAAVNDYHGTACAGAAAANSRSLRGVAPHADILPIKIFRGNEMAAHEQVADAIRTAWDRGARVLSCSWFVVPDRKRADDQIRDAVQRVVDKGAIVVCAAGNDGSTTIREPAAYPECIAVGAVSRTGYRAERSNHGPGVCVYAPSRFVSKVRTGKGKVRKPAVVGIRTTDCRGPKIGFKAAGDDPADPLGLVHDLFGGTSAATAIVAGLVALLVEANPNLDARGARRILRASADRMKRNSGLQVNAAKAVAMALRR